MKRNLILLTFLASALVFALADRAPAQVGSRLVVCPPVEIPEGWLKVDVLSSPATCGGDAWVLETTDKAIGSAMVVCSDQPTPTGWETLNVTTSSGQCAGDTLAEDNVKVIRRVG